MQAFFPPPEKNVTKKIDKCHNFSRQMSQIFLANVTVFRSKCHKKSPEQCPNNCPTKCPFPKNSKFKCFQLQNKIFIAHGGGGGGGGGGGDGNEGEEEEDEVAFFQNLDFGRDVEYDPDAPVDRLPPMPHQREQRNARWTDEHTSGACRSIRRNSVSGPWAQNTGNRNLRAIQSSIWRAQQKIFSEEFGPTYQKFSQSKKRSRAAHSESGASSPKSGG